MEWMTIGAAEKLRHSRSLFEVRRFAAENLPFKPKGPGLKSVFISRLWSQEYALTAGVRLLTCEIPAPAFELRLWTAWAGAGGLNEAFVGFHVPWRGGAALGGLLTLPGQLASLPFPLTNLGPERPCCFCSTAKYPLNRSRGLM